VDLVDRLVEFLDAGTCFSAPCSVVRGYILIPIQRVRSIISGEDAPRGRDQRALQLPIALPQFAQHRQKLPADLIHFRGDWTRRKTRTIQEEGDVLGRGA